MMHFVTILPCKVASRHRCAEELLLFHLTNMFFSHENSRSSPAPPAGDVNTEDSAVPREAETSRILWPKKLMECFSGSNAFVSCRVATPQHFTQDPHTDACDSELSGIYLTSFVKRRRQTIEGTVLWNNQDFSYPGLLLEFSKSYPIPSLWAKLRGRQCRADG